MIKNIRLLWLGLLFLVALSGTALVANAAASQHPAQGKAMTTEDRSKLVSATEDFNFQDYDAAIPQLRTLYQRYPTNHEVLRTFARALNESGQAQAAIPLFQSWIKHYPEDRKAYISLAGALSKTKNTDAASQILQSWIKVHPNDANARISLINILIRSTKTQQHDQAQAQAFAIVQNPATHPATLSAAYYYLAYIALQQGDSDTAQKKASASIKASATSTYAKRSQALITRMQAARAKTEGTHASISVGSYYTNNASSLPEKLRQTPTLRSDPTKPAGDSALQTAIHLGYQKSAWGIAYDMNSTVYQDRIDLNLMMQRASVSWTKGHFSIAPRYENVRFGKNFLYQGGGVDITWLLGKKLMLYYGGAFKIFSKKLGSGANAPNLGRLNGISHDMMAQYALPGFTPTGRFSLGVTLHEEDTRGDPSYNKSDSYRQLGASVGWLKQIPLPRTSVKIHSSLTLQGYYRGYLHTNPVVLPTGSQIKRKDRFMQYSYRLSAKPFKSLPMTWSGYWQWQRNLSNYNSRLIRDLNSVGEFTEWRLGGAIQWTF
ncbi:MAG: tetratricopeptide repeat protein [Mariprofundales bacterium]|nr:tetratricopeptide repeat protein [Mariprofundales bacterium]